MWGVYSSKGNVKLKATSFLVLFFPTLINLVLNVINLLCVNSGLFDFHSAFAAIMTSQEQMRLSLYTAKYTNAIYPS